MDYLKFEVVIEKDPTGFAEDLIINTFADNGIEGSEIADPHLKPDEGWGNDAVPKPDAHSVSVYIPDDKTTKELSRRLEKEIKRLEDSNSLELSVRYSVIKKEDWSETWKEFFKPEKITDTLVVKPSWHDYSPKEHEKIIEIDPGMAFGTGTHPTTSQCIMFLEKYVRPGSSVLDIGTGSGILLVAAHLLGAVKLTGTDTDNVAVSIARDNLRLNCIEPGDFKLIECSLLDGIAGSFDVIIANILAEVVDVLLGDVSRIMSDNSILICSGIIDERKPMIEEKIKKMGLEIIESRIKDSWVALVIRKKRV